METSQCNNNNISMSNKPNSSNSSNNSWYKSNKWWQTSLHNNSNTCKPSWWVCSSNRIKCSQLWCLKLSNNLHNSKSKTSLAIKRNRKEGIKLIIRWCKHFNNNNKDLTSRPTKTSKWIIWTKWTRWIKWTQCYFSNKWFIKCNIGNHTNIIIIDSNKEIIESTITKNKIMRRLLEKVKRLSNKILKLNQKTTVLFSKNLNIYSNSPKTMTLINIKIPK